MGIRGVRIFAAEVSPIAAVIGGVLAGMGIDYSVLYLTRFEALRLGGAVPQEAAERTIADIGSAIFAAFITSIAGFLAIGFSSVKALRDFSILGSLGLCGSFLAALAVGPSVLVLLPQRNARPALRISMEPLLQWMVRHRTHLRGGDIGLPGLHRHRRGAGRAADSAASRI